ncbi:MAG: hypothetical protein JHC31_11870 [Sulfurihydrogenibium sp.]|jgi:hypothetical protein|nr:hypothetical protein [Sulfurihydrogenibium sp.]
MKNKLAKILSTITTISIASCSANINTSTTKDPFDSFSPSNKPILENLVKTTATTKKPTTYIINNNIYSTTYNGRTIKHCDLVSLTVKYANTNYERTENFRVCGDKIENIGISDTIPSTIENDPIVQNQIPYILQTCKIYGEAESIVTNRDISIKCKATDLNRCFLELTFIDKNGILIDKKIINTCR